MKISNVMSKVAAIVAASVSGSVCAMASNTADGIITNAKTQVTGIANDFIDLILVIFGMVGIVFVVINGIKYFKGDHDSENALFKVGIGLIIGVIVIFVIKEAFIR